LWLGGSALSWTAALTRTAALSWTAAITYPRTYPRTSPDSLGSFRTTSLTRTAASTYPRTSPDSLGGFVAALFAEEFEALVRDFQVDLLEFGPLQGDHAIGEVFVNGQLVEHLLAGRDDPVLRRLGVRRGEGEKELVAVDSSFGDVSGVVGKRGGSSTKLRCASHF
jgi:hypothetical protein